ncbi:MAG: inositol monophosphatase [Desulfobulbaceae bacterium]|nr:inositol monophosphatase [Desulfobulbaceae bacterium]
MNRIDAVVRKCSDPELALLLQAACRAALTAGSIIRELYNKPHNIEMKGVINLVTEADFASETAILASLGEDAPGIDVMAEESAGEDVKEPEGKVWVIDPLDGTTNFAHGFPVFAVSIALLDSGSPLLGVIFCPMQNELFCSWQGGGAWLDDRKIQVTETRFLVESLIATGFPYDIHARLDTVLAQLRAMLPKVRDMRRAGAAAVDLAYVACGRLDGFYEMDLKPWDSAAGWLLVEEAGGIVTDFGGKKYSPFVPEILAANRELHPLLLDLLK